MIRSDDPSRQTCRLLVLPCSSGSCSFYSCTSAVKGRTRFRTIVVPFPECLPAHLRADGFICYLGRAAYNVRRVALTHSSITHPMAGKSGCNQGCARRMECGSQDADPTVRQCCATPSPRPSPRPRARQYPWPTSRDERCAPKAHIPACSCGRCVLQEEGGAIRTQDIAPWSLGCMHASLRIEVLE